MAAVAVAALIFGLWSGSPAADPTDAAAPGAPSEIGTDPAVTVRGLDVATWFGDGVKIATAGPVLWAVEPDTGRTARYEDGVWAEGDPLPDQPPGFLTDASISWVGVDPSDRVWMSGYAAVEVLEGSRRFDAVTWYADGDRWQLLPRSPASEEGVSALVGWHQVVFDPHGETVYLVHPHSGALLAWDGAGYRRIVTPTIEVRAGSDTSDVTTVPAVIRGMAVADDGSLWTYGEYASWEIWFGAPFFAVHDPISGAWTEGSPWVDSSRATWMTTASTGELWVGFEDADEWDDVGWAIARLSPDTGSWTVFEQFGPTLADRRVLAADDRSVWLQGWDGLGVVRLRADGWTSYLEDRRVSGLAIAPDGTRWAVFRGERGVHELVLPEESG